MKDVALCPFKVLSGGAAYRRLQVQYFTREEKSKLYKFHLEEGFFHGRHQEEETAPCTCGVVLKCISPAPVVYRAQRSCRCVHSTASFRDRDDSQVPDNCLRCGVRDNGLSSLSTLPAKPLVMEDQLAVGLFFGGSRPHLQ